MILSLQYYSFTEHSSLTRVNLYTTLRSWFYGEVLQPSPLNVNNYSAHMQANALKSNQVGIRSDLLPSWWDQSPSIHTDWPEQSISNDNALV